jgi:flagellar protein FlaG
MSISAVQQVVQRIPLSDETALQRAPQTPQRPAGEASAAPAEPAPQRLQLDAAKEAERVAKATELLNAFMERSSIAVRFSIDPDSDKLVVKVVKAQNGELIRQIPSELAIKLSHALDTLNGLIIQAKA